MPTTDGAHKNRSDLLRLRVREHVKSFWPASAVMEHIQSAGPINDSLPGFMIITAMPANHKEPSIYVTNGCFAVETGLHIRHEFFLLSPRPEVSHIHTLTMLANFHADERYRLDVGKVVAIGDPWLAGSTCDHVLVSLPYPYAARGQELEWLRLEDVCVRFLWLMPITAREAAFAELHGTEALEQKFDQQKPDYLDPFRTSVI